MSEFEDVTLVITGQVPFEDMIPPMHPLHKAMKDVITEASDMAWFHMGGNLPAKKPAIPPAPPANNNAAGGVLNADSLHQFAEAIAHNSRSSTEKEQAAFATTTAHRFQVAFARLEPSPNIGEMPTVVPATLSAGALEVLKATKLDTARRLFREQIDTDVRAAGRLSLIHISEPTRPY